MLDGPEAALETLICAIPPLQGELWRLIRSKRERDAAPLGPAPRRNPQSA